MAEMDRRHSGVDLSGPEHTALIEQLRQLALRDPLTGLLNRRGFDEELLRIWGLSQIHSFPIGLLIIDIDHFKSINDSYGHFVGDQVLKECVRLIQASIRESDIVCRYYGGDELVVILPDSKLSETRRVAERMLEKFKSEVVCKGTYDLRVTISVGACQMAAAPNQTADRFLIQADRALYRAKQTGRNKVCFADEPIDFSAPPESLASVEPAPAGTAAPRHVVLVVDDDRQTCELFQEMLKLLKFDVHVAETYEQAVATVEKERGMIDVALVDLHLGERNGLELLKEIRGLDESMIGVIVTGQATVDNATEALRHGAYDFVQKPVSLQQLGTVLERAVKCRRLVLENKRYQLHLEDMVREKNAALSRALDQASESYQFTLEAMADVLDAREKMTGEHSRRVARTSMVLARAMGVRPEEIQTIETGALLHDIGKIGIPDSILLKPSRLTHEEHEMMNRHPHLGYNFIKAGPGMEEASEIVLAHHEHFDGTGYPRGLKGDDICLGARIFAVIDAYDAIRADRPYAKGRSAEETLREIIKHKGTQFDPVVVEALERCQGEIEKVGGWSSPVTKG